MTGSLTDEQIARFRRDGFLFPVDVCSGREAAALHARFEALEQALGEEPQVRFRVKAHLPFPWLCDLVRRPALLDAVESLVGPDILCWGASFFTKKARDPRFISWHTDSFYYGFEPAETMTAWFSFNDATEDAGCVRYIPGSHRKPAVHEFRPEPDNLAGEGQTVIGVDESRAVNAVVRAGQAVFHHESVVHSSRPNRSDHPRIGLAIHYCAPHVRETRFAGAAAMLLRGTDRTGNWQPDPEPAREFDPVCIEAMLETRRRFKQAASRKVVDGVRS